MEIGKLLAICGTIVLVMLLMGVFPTLAVGVFMLAVVVLFILDRN